MHRHRHHLDREEHQETRELVKSAFSLARALGIKTLVVQSGRDQRQAPGGAGARRRARHLGHSRTEADARSLILPKTSCWSCRMPF
jgi:hypothetical protein